MLNLGSEQKKNQERKNKKLELASKYLGDFFVVFLKKKYDNHNKKIQLLDFFLLGIFSKEKSKQPIGQKETEVKSQKSKLFTTNVDQLTKKNK
jgi:hypothetical protein